ncbi:LysR family transcriptional regulator [Vacuolonema iberomarrocanum]|uniref:LysR family transcriptional regulator n=1 Tax=Vacuolonema iberomarrocanum TaxID=3454632 RepID=UPI001A0B3134|nr:LysR family transcriptional regulator [filamentous cyanobacterium LEGE 07170]
MDVDQLIAFEQVVREGSFSKAAWSLGIAQPTISARIQGLEKEVGGALFKRGRKIVLTELGNTFLPYVQQILSSLQDGMEAARLVHEGDRGRLSIGILRSLAGSFISPALATFHQHYPDVEYYIQENDHWSLVKRLCDGVIELAFICWPCIDPIIADMTPVLSIREPIVFAVPSTSPLAKRDAVSQTELLSYANPLLLLRWWQVTPMAITRLVSQAKSVASVPMDTGRFLLKNGIGMGFFTEATILPDIEAGQVVSLPVPDFPPTVREIALVHLTRQTTLSTAATNFIRLMKEQVQQP